MTGRAARKVERRRRSVLRSLVAIRFRSRAVGSNKEGNEYVAHWKKTDSGSRGVKVQISAAAVDVQGPKGKMSVQLATRNSLRAERRRAARAARYRRTSRVARAGARSGRQCRHRRHHGLQEGSRYRRRRVSRRSQRQERVFLLGYSHPIEFPIPEGIQITWKSRRTDGFAARIALRSARCPPTFARCVRPTRTSKRAFALRASG